MDILFKVIICKEAHNSQNYWGQGAIKQTAGGKANYAQGVKLIGIGMHKGLGLGIGEHKGLSFCQTVAVLSRFVTCHTCHIV